MSELKEYSIEDFAEILNHRRIPLSSMERTKKKGAFPYYGASGVIDYIDEYIFEGDHVLISEDGENLKSRNTPIAFVASGKFWVNNHAHIVKGKKDIYNKLIVYYMQNLDLNPFLSGAVQPKLNKAALTSIPFFLPSNENEQTAIASILSSLDDKIDLLHRQNTTLEKMAETLFRQWFIEEAKEEWENCFLEDLCTQINSGGTPSTKIESYYNGKINWYSTKELKDNFLFESSSKITSDGLHNSSAKLFPKGTVLIAIYAAPTVGRLGILTNDAAFNQAACGLIANITICCKEFIYLYLKSQREEFNSMASGSAQQNLNVGKIKNYPAFIPDNETMVYFKNEVIPIFNKIEANTNQIRTLTTLRDTLLPKLMSGEVRVEK